MSQAIDTLEPLYRHTKREEWGLAILAWEGDGRRQYQFQDGRLRTFKQGYYDFLQPAHEPAEKAQRIIRNLKAMLKTSGTTVDQSAGADDGLDVALSEQVALFEDLYSDGFDDEKYIKDVRGEEGKRRLKRHRDAAILDAQERLSKDNLDRMIGESDFEGVKKLLLDVLDSTDLVSKRDLDPLKKIKDPKKLSDLAKSLRDMLWSDTPYGGRFTGFVETLDSVPGTKVTWPIATAPSALVHPTVHVAVKPTVFKKQMSAMAPNVRWDNRPNAELYDRVQQVATDIRDRLNTVGKNARDLFDVYQLVWLTLRPKGLEQIEQMKDDD